MIVLECAVVKTTLAPTMTAEEFYEWANSPDRGEHLYELERGEILEMPNPGERHGTVCANIVIELGLYVRKRRAGQVLSNDTGLVVEEGPDTVRGPDVTMFLERRTMSQVGVGHLRRVPELVVEVLSPSDRFLRVLRRVEQYHSFGVAIVWVVDPEESAVLQCRAGELHKRFDLTDTITGNGVLPDFECRVADFFTLPGDDPNRMPA
jgi:Uma2 family endonuclease